MGMWDDENEEGFRDVPEEAATVQAPNPAGQLPPGVQEVSKPRLDYEKIKQAADRMRAQAIPQEEIPSEGHFVPGGPTDEEFLESLEEEDFTEVLNDANLRIEQGRLYQMIMNHDLFEGMDADPRAVANVQREIRKFARESMEVMLGMRETTPVRAQVASPFNDLEVDILKKIASKATNGATESPEANQVAAAVREIPKRQTIKTIGGSTGLKKTAPAPAPRQQPKPQARPAQPLQSKPAQPVARAKKDETIDQILAEEGLTRADVELEYQGIGKQLHELTAEELAQRAKDSAARLQSRKTVKSTTAIPMASPEQAALLAVERATQMGAAERMDGLKIPGGMAALLDKVKQMPIKNP